jgi:hypothetical protein
MGKLRPPYFNSATLTGTSVDIPIINNQVERIWVVEQIQVQYSINTDAPTVAIIVDGKTYSGPAQMLKGNNGVGQTFAGQPWLYIEAGDGVKVRVQDGTVGANVTVQVQYREIGYSDDELKGRF